SVILLNDDRVFMFSPLLLHSGLDRDQACFLPAHKDRQPGLRLDLEVEFQQRMFNYFPNVSLLLDEIPHFIGRRLQDVVNKMSILLFQSMAERPRFQVCQASQAWCGYLLQFTWDRTQ